VAAKGRPYGRCARNGRLGLKRRPTVKTYVKRAMAKLGAHDRAQLVVIAYETGLIHLGTD
jgi:hypothetical protein